MRHFLNYLNYSYLLKEDSAAQSSLRRIVTELIYLELHTSLPNIVINYIKNIKMNDIRNIFGETRNLKEVQFQTTGNETIEDVICIYIYLHICMWIFGCVVRMCDQVNEDEVYVICSMHGRIRMRNVKKIKGRDHMGGMDEDWRMILK